MALLHLQCCPATGKLTEPFAVMSSNARPATTFFRLLPNRVVELGAQVEL